MKPSEMTSPKEALDAIVRMKPICPNFYTDRMQELAKAAIPVAELYQEAMAIVFMILDQNVNLTKVFVKANKLRPKLVALKAKGE